MAIFLILQEFIKVPKNLQNHINSRKTPIPGIRTNVWKNWGVLGNSHSKRLWNMSDKTCNLSVHHTLSPIKESPNV